MSTTLATTFKGRWGYYPCSYETYRKLKRLNWLALQALKVDKQWNRWDAKMPHNRFFRKRIKDENGRVIGREWALDENGNKIPWPEPNTFKGVFPSSLEADYRSARYPAPTPEAVKPLQTDEEAIDSCLAKAESWYASLKVE